MLEESIRVCVRIIADVVAYSTFQVFGVGPGNPKVMRDHRLRRSHHDQWLLDRVRQSWRKARLVIIIIHDHLLLIVVQIVVMGGG